MKDKIKKLEREVTTFNKAGLNTTSLEKSISILKKEYHSQLSAWDKVNIARDKNRPTSRAFINKIFDSFIELHGDRYYKDDKAIIGGIAYLNDLPVTVIGVEKGFDTQSKIENNFGMPQPEGYRKALRLMKQASKFKRPIICLIDTPGAYPGIEAEARGQGSAIAHNLMEMFDLKVPIISIVIGEGGSGGALALAIANQVWMLENAMYSILSPEGYASILYKDGSRASEIVDDMKITSESLFELGLIDHIINEGEHGIEEEFNTICLDIKEKLVYEIGLYLKQSSTNIIKERYLKFRSFK
ncbi:MAG: acetyl-CoA carboxylase carboxyltransferase subunit alpha [Bacilli bacterium]